MEDLYVDDPAYYHPTYTCSLGHTRCSSKPDGQCAGQSVLWDEREFGMPNMDEIDDIIRGIRREYNISKKEY